MSVSQAMNGRLGDCEVVARYKLAWHSWDARNSQHSDPPFIFSHSDRSHPAYLSSLLRLIAQQVMQQHRVPVKEGRRGSVRERRAAVAVDVRDWTDLLRYSCCLQKCDRSWFIPTSLYACCVGSTSSPAHANFSVFDVDYGRFPRCSCIASTCRPATSNHHGGSATKHEHAEKRSGRFQITRCSDGGCTAICAAELQTLAGSSDPNAACTNLSCSICCNPLQTHLCFICWPKSFCCPSTSADGCCAHSCSAGSSQHSNSSLFIENTCPERLADDLCTTVCKNCS
jgi:hypothetical protein